MHRRSAHPEVTVRPWTPAARAAGCGLALAALGALSAACASGAGAGPVVAPETIDRSEDLEGQQEATMQQLNQTPSEQAGARHYQDTAPPPEREGD